MKYQEHAQEWTAEIMERFDISGNDEKSKLLMVAQNWFRGIYDLRDFVLESSEIIGQSREEIARYFADRYGEDIFDQVMDWLSE